MIKLWYAVVVCVAVFSATGLAFPFSNDFPISLMDLNGDEQISLAEYLQSFDLGHRLVTVQARTCTEVFSLKDGSPLKVVCHQG